MSGVDNLIASFDAVEGASVPDARPMLAGGRAPSMSRGALFEGFVRSGARIETKALAGTSNAAGSFAVPREIDAMIDETLASISPIRAIANVVKVGSAGYRKLVTSGGTPSGWASGTGARIKTGTPTGSAAAAPDGGGSMASVSRRPKSASCIASR